MVSSTIPLRARAEIERRRRAMAGMLDLPPQNWEKWLTKLFPNLFYLPFALHHNDFWDWVDAITLIEKPIPFFAIWARGGAKTTNAEAAVVRVGAKGTRKFVLYVRATQDKANESVINIASMLEGKEFAKYYPRLSNRKLSKYGFARGWRVDTLRCDSGFSVVGLGLDAAIRGIKIEAARPDLIVLDDIDDMHDGIAAVNKKINTLTTAILPAGASNVAILGMQNLIHSASIFNQLAEGTAEFLHDRIISGPYPAVKDLEYTAKHEGGYVITGGHATWQGQPLEVCQKQMREWGLTAFLREAQHDLAQHGGVWDHIEFIHCEWADIPELEKGAVWVDPAVTSTDQSDAMGIQADGLGVDGKLYRMYSWEQITSPEDALKRAILKCLELGFTTVGVETDQGGDLWHTAYISVWKQLVEMGIVKSDRTENGIFIPGDRMPTFKAAKAGAGHGSKAARNQRMLVDYERGKIIHVRGTHKTLDRALKRFPSKPLDLVDASYWSWHDLMGGMSGSAKVGTLTSRRNTQKQVISRVSQELATLHYKGNRSFPLITSQYRWNISPGWQRNIDLALAQQVASKFPNYFEILEV